MGTHAEKKSIFSRYGLAVLAALVAVGLKFAVSHVVPRGIPIIVLVPLISAYWGGLGPGILGAGLCSLANLYFFAPTGNSLALHSIHPIAEFLVFSGMSIFVSTLKSSLWEAKEKALKASERRADQNCKGREDYRDAFVLIWRNYGWKKFEGCSK